MKRKVFSKSWVNTYAYIFTFFTLFLYVTSIITRVQNHYLSFFGKLFLGILLINSIFQMFLLFNRNSKIIIIINIHLLLLMFYLIFELVTNLIIFKTYNQVINGIFWLIIIICINYFIFNKYKLYLKDQAEIDEIGKNGN